ncbi:hypothetical protein LTR56_026351 [Elasticomyces elasticus]|nr:hypothetical protein LTR56_026351 [Elasticomyces elasticus]KAK3663887.1 hypothetical protein LTR22_005348 [Elasticomyces elasticus]KAK5736997.1 hypothetical protein LTS12_026010 [Elasticomyces elasticus]
MAQLDSTRSTGAYSSTPQIKTHPNHEPDIQLSRSSGINNFFACSGHEYTLTPQRHPRYVKTTFDQSDGQDNLSGQAPEVLASTSASSSAKSKVDEVSLSTVGSPQSGDSYKTTNLSCEAISSGSSGSTGSERLFVRLTIPQISKLQPLHDQSDGLPLTQTPADLFQLDHITTSEATSCTPIKSKAEPMVIKQEASAESTTPETQTSYEKHTFGTSWKRKAIEADQDDEGIKYSAKIPRTSVSHPSDRSSQHAQARVEWKEFDRAHAKLQVSHVTDAVKAAIVELTKRHAKYLQVIRNPGNDEELRQTLAMEAKVIEHIKAISDAVTADHEAKLGS